jgi:hypothetical protein
MRKSITLALSAFGLLSLTSLAARANHQAIQGRTGLPVVREGGENVEIRQGQVNLRVDGGDLVVTQDYRLFYPGPPLETGAQRIKVAVREDFYRGRDEGDPELVKSDARGFTRFAVYLDGRRANSWALPWEMNDKLDTATRWREWWMGFRPGQTRRLRIVSRAPLGRQDNKRWVNFVVKDLGHWRHAPENLVIYFRAPGSMEGQLAGLEPKPDDVNARAIRWVYRKADPDRDIFILLPAAYQNRTTLR